MIPMSARPGRNEPCPCGSGRKFKHCCADAKRAPGSAVIPPDFKTLLSSARQRAAAQDWETAEALFRQAASLRPKDAFALAELGQCLCWMRRKREGLGWLRKAGERLLATVRRSDPVGPLIDLATQLQFWGEAEMAGRLAELAVRHAPREAAAHHTLALSMDRLHRDDAAFKAAAKASELAPEEPNSAILLGQLILRRGDPETAEARFRAVLSATRDGQAQARAWLELGRALDRLGRYDEAFSAFGEARRLEALTPQARAIDHALAHERLAANAARFSAAYLRSRAERFASDGLPSPVFLVGFLRSGTTLTEQVLAAHPAVVTGDETDILFELSEELARMTGPGADVGGKLERLSDAELGHLRRFYWRRVEEEQGADALSRTYVDKNALNCIDAGLINAVFPDARIVFALRDPRDVLLSCFMQSFGLSPVTVRLLSWDSAARFYRDVMEFWLAIRDRLTIPYLELRYEDAVADFDGRYRRLFDFLGLDWDPEVTRFHEKAKGKYIATPSFADVAKPVYRSAVGRWTHYRRHLEAVGAEIDQLVARLGYAAPDDGGSPASPAPSETGS
ncbi:MAG: sulfotransferase [Gammaproteobacteria bacterium]|nr:sulfotransferase [Gammaproteobacteria bacterium]